MARTRRRPTPPRLTLVALALAALALLAAVTVGIAAAQFRRADTMAPNVTIAGVKVGGLSAPQAKQAILKSWAPTLPTEVQLRYEGGSAKASPRELGAQLNLDEAIQQALRVGREGSLLALVVQHVKLRSKGVDVAVASAVDAATLEGYLKGIAPNIERTPRNADIRVVGERVEVVPGEDGRRLDVAASVSRLTKALANPSLTTADLVVTTRTPAIRAEDLQHLEVVLASYTTHYRTWQTDRTHNLGLALGNLSRAVLMPGDSLSLNDRIGPRLEERGYRSAPIFVNGEVEPSTGGGVCQVATTVYNAALLAGLDVVERHHHSRPVDYAPSGRDATVYWGQFDLRIRNPLSHPILFLGDIDGGEMTVRILGSRADRCDVDIDRSGVSTLSFGTKEVPDPNLEQGKREVETKGRSGVHVTVSRTIKREGQPPKTETLHTDTYSPQTQVVRVGTMPPTIPPGTLPPGTVPGKPGAAAPTTPGPTQPGRTPARPGTRPAKPSTRPTGSSD